MQEGGILWYNFNGESLLYIFEIIYFMYLISFMNSLVLYDRMDY